MAHVRWAVATFFLGAAVIVTNGSPRDRFACPVNGRTTLCGIQQRLCDRFGGGFPKRCEAPQQCCDFGCKIRCSPVCLGGCPAGQQCIADGDSAQCQPKPITCRDTGCPPGHSCQRGPDGPVCRSNLLPSCKTIKCRPGQLCRLVKTPRFPPPSKLFHQVSTGRDGLKPECYFIPV